MHVFFFVCAENPPKKGFYKNTSESHIVEPFEIFWTFNNITNPSFYVKPSINSFQSKYSTIN